MWVCWGRVAVQGIFLTGGIAWCPLLIGQPVGHLENEREPLKALSGQRLVDHQGSTLPPIGGIVLPPKNNTQEMPLLGLSAVCSIQQQPPESRPRKVHALKVKLVLKHVLYAHRGYTWVAL